RAGSGEAAGGSEVPRRSRRYLDLAIGRNRPSRALVFVADLGAALQEQLLRLRQRPTQLPAEAQDELPRLYFASLVGVSIRAAGVGGLDDEGHEAAPVGS